MSADLRSMTEVNRLIHEPARMMIVTILYVAQQADFLYLLRETGLSKGNLSAHLSKLEDAGYVRIEKTYRGKVPLTLIELTPTGRVAFENYRAQLRQIVDSLSEE